MVPLPSRYRCTFERICTNIVVISSIGVLTFVKSTGSYLLIRFFYIRIRRYFSLKNCVRYCIYSEFL